jgi:GTP pyrophosphokinase
VDWSDEPTRMFETAITVTVSNGMGVLARIASELASSEADIVRVDMDDAMDTIDLRFVVAVRDLAHMETVLRNLRRTQSVLRAFRVLPQPA